MGIRPGPGVHRPVRHDIILQSTSLSVLYHFRCALSRKRDHFPSECLWKALFQRILMAVRWHREKKNTRKSQHVTSPQGNVTRVIQKSIALTNICNISIVQNWWCHQAANLVPRFILEVNYWVITRFSELHGTHKALQSGKRIMIVIK